MTSRADSDLYEVMLIIKADSDEAAHDAANEAWASANETSGAQVYDSAARIRKPDGTLEDVGWSDWADPPGFTLSVGYDEMDADEPDH